MLDFGFFIYGLLAAFVLTSMSRNRRERRPDAPIVALIGHGLLSASFTLCALLTTLAIWTVLKG